ncbi:tail sheath protein [Erwinia phage Farigoule]|nr:tail sheath protein [Erwinia phage Farigoule]
MSIPISDIIDVQIAVAPNAVATDGYGPIVFMTKEFQPVMGENNIRIFTGFKQVQDAYPTGGDEIVKAAEAWYSQKPTPKTFCVGSISSSSGQPATTGKLVGGAAAVLADLKAITAGAMDIVVDGLPAQKITGLDLSSAADLAAVATLVEGELTGVTVSQSAGIFSITSATLGAKSTVAIPAATPLATALKLTTAAGATSTPGTDAIGIKTDLAKMAQAASKAKQFFFYVAGERALRDTTRYLEMAEWAEASNKVFGLASNKTDVLNASNTANYFAQAKAKNFQRTICVYDASNGGVEYPEISILGRASTVNFNVANSALVLAFKKGPTITTADLTPEELAGLQSHNGNAFISVDDNVMFWNGVMADGTWFDTVQGVSWLSQKVQVNVFNLFYQSTTKIPWTETGVAMVNQQVTLALELARTNGLIAPGYDNEGVFYPDGYKVISTDLALLQSQKGKRIWEGTSFIAIGSGALQGAVISGNFVQ